MGCVWGGGGVEGGRGVWPHRLSADCVFVHQVRPDVVVGDRHGASCAPWLTHAVTSVLKGKGLSFKVRLGGVLGGEEGGEQWVCRYRGRGGGDWGCPGTRVLDSPAAQQADESL